MADAGSWRIGGKLMFVSTWLRENSSACSFYSRFPIWVKLHDIPDIFWTPEGLGHLASKIGKPIAVDHSTANMQFLNFAKVRVEVEAGVSRPKLIKVRTSEFEVKEVKVEYMGCPPSCGKCKLFGHVDFQCLKEDEIPVEAVDEGLSGCQEGNGADVVKGDGQLDPATAVPTQSDIGKDEDTKRQEVEGVIPQPCMDETVVAEGTGSNVSPSRKDIKEIKEEEDFIPFLSKSQQKRNRKKSSGKPMQNVKERGVDSCKGAKARGKLMGKHGVGKQFGISLPNKVKHVATSNGRGASSGLGNAILHHTMEEEKSKKEEGNAILHMDS